MDYKDKYQQVVGEIFDEAVCGWPFSTEKCKMKILEILKNNFPPEKKEPKRLPRHEEVNVVVDGKFYQVRGKYIPFERGRITDDPDTSRPDEGGYFDDVYIYCEDDIAEDLRPEIRDRIVEEAEREMHG